MAPALQAPAQHLISTCLDRPTADDLDEYLAVMDRVSTAYQAMKRADPSQYGSTLQSMASEHDEAQ